MTKNTAIKVQNLTKTYKLYDKPIDRLKESLHPLKKKYHRDFYALNDVSFEIKKGETVGIVGKNGSGKSTLLKIITGVLTPTSGKISVHGKISAILELGAGFNPEMTGLENVYLNTSINGMSKKETDSKIKEIVEFAELGEFIHQPVKTYSSGMKARLAFSVSISVEPDILIVDEALSVGDAAFARKCFAKMEEIRSRGATILFVSHSEGSVVALCNRAIWVSNGKQIIDGTPKLVTGLYMKHINETKIDKAEIEKEYDSLANPKEEMLQEKTQLEEKSKILNTEHCKLNATNSIDEFYNPALKPTSTICYEEKGAKISDIKITTLDGREANVLVQGGEYILSHKVDFAEKNNNVILGISLHTKQGVILVNGHFPEQKKYHIINAKNIFVEWKFSCTVLEGEYFLTLGVMGIDNKFMARIKDAYMFKVINNKNRQMRGLIDLNLKGNIEIC